MRRWRNILGCMALVALAASAVSACGAEDTSAPEPPVKAASETQEADAAISSDDTTETVTQAVTNPNGANYFVAAGEFIDLVGEDGRPDEAAGLLVNEGTGITAGTPNERGWLVTGPTGLVSFLDEDGNPLSGTLRTAIQGNGVRFAALGRRTPGGVAMEQSAWLLGGENGRAHFFNLDAQPEGDNFEGQILASGATLLSGAYDEASEQWFVGAEDGSLVRVSEDFSFGSVTNAFAGKPIRAIVSNPNNASGRRWLLAVGTEVAYFPAQGSPFDYGVDITSIARATEDADNAERVAIGTADGRVAFFDFELVDGNPQWNNVLGGREVTNIIHNGTEWLVLGVEGYAQVIASDGTAVTQPTLIGDGAALTTARWANDRWLIATESSFVISLSDMLVNPVSYDTPLDGAEVRDAAPGHDVVAIVGDDGAYRVLDEQGGAMTEVMTLSGAGDLHAVGYSGQNFLIGGDDGNAAIIGNDGEVIGEPLTLLDGRTIRTISWSGNFWIVAGDEGYTQRVRPTGQTVSQAQQFSAFDTIADARWSGSVWMLVGESEGASVFLIVGSDGAAISQPSSVPTLEALRCGVERARVDRRWDRRSGAAHRPIGASA